MKEQQRGRPTELRTHGLIKSYGSVGVLKAVDFKITSGRVTGLIGENGAGKSTLSSIIAGVVTANGGRMEIDGLPYQPSSPLDALNRGVAIIHQEIKLIPELSVAENLFLGRMPTRAGRVDYRAMAEQAAEALAKLGVKLDPRRAVSGLSTAAQQEIEIARAILRQPDFVIFDEPSASLGQQETQRVLDQIELLRSAGAGIVYISHRLEEITQVSDEVVCLRDGSKVAEWASKEATRHDMIRAMVGRELGSRDIPPPPPGSEIVLEVRDLQGKAFEGINFDLRAGEILGVAGLVGAGRTEIFRAIAGADKVTSGTVTVEGQPVRRGSVQNSIAAGIVMVPEDRKTQGLNLDRCGTDNITLPWERTLARYGLVTSTVRERIKKRMLDELDIRGNLDAPVGRLSGGNQQKVLLGKWLVRTPKVLILDEPTRGVDVGAKDAIYEIIRNLAGAGVSIIVVSSELEEVLLLAHRVLVIAAGRQTALLPREEAEPTAVLTHAVPPGGAVLTATA